MIQNPFTILHPFADKLHVVIVQKGDSTDLGELQKTFDVQTIIRPKQVHGTSTVVVHDIPLNQPEADGIATDTERIGLAVSWADCQNFLVFEPTKNILGLMHVGWRGLRDGMIPNFFKTLRGEWGVDPKETYVCAGPSLCGNCAEFTDPKTELAGIPEKFFSGRHADLPRIADWQLQKLGIPKDHVERMSNCTKEQLESFWTYRGGDQEAVKEGNTNLLIAYLTGNTIQL